MSPFHRIYQYRSDKSQRDLNTLLSCCFYSARIERLNDPFEFYNLRNASGDSQLRGPYENSGVTCFCRSLTNPLLWSHYAAGHTGFAIGIDTTHFNKLSAAGAGGARILLDVHYEDVPPTFDRFGNFLGLATALTKPTCWAYEQEVRLICSPGDQLIKLPPNVFVEIAFGARMTDERVREIIDQVKQSEIRAEFTQMRPVEGGFGVTPSPVST